MSTEMPSSGPVSAVAWALRAVQRADLDARRALASRLGLGTRDVEALELLALGEPLGPAELGRRLNITSASATVMVTRLEVAGHVRRESHPDDRRRRTVVVTPAALEQILSALAPLTASIDAAAAELTPSQARATQSFLESVATAMRAYGAGPQASYPTASGGPNTTGTPGE